MINEEIIQALRDMNEKQVEELEPNTRKLFDAVMSIADERDELRKKVRLLNKQNEELYKKYCDTLLKLDDALMQNKAWFQARTHIEKLLKD